MNFICLTHFSCRVTFHNFLHMLHMFFFTCDFLRVILSTVFTWCQQCLLEFACNNIVKWAVTRSSLMTDFYYSHNHTDATYDHAKCTGSFPKSGRMGVYLYCLITADGTELLYFACKRWKKFRENSPGKMLQHLVFTSQVPTPVTLLTSCSEWLCFFLKKKGTETCLYQHCTSRLAFFCPFFFAK